MKRCGQRSSCRYADLEINVVLSFCFCFLFVVLLEKICVIPRQLNPELSVPLFVGVSSEL